MQILEHITINENSRIPKYRQIVESIIDNISSGKLKVDEKIPSINMLSEEFDLSRDTVEKAYKILKERNIITSVMGKGYYVTRTSLISQVNVLFLVNKLSNYKMRIYNSFIQELQGSSHTDLHIYHCDETLFLNLLKKNLKTYDYFVIMPHFKTSALRHVSFTDDVVETLNKIPKHKLLILDNNLTGLTGEFSIVYQDFENDIYKALTDGLEKIRKYKKIFLVYPERSIYPYPRRIMHGFRKFCVKFKMDFEVIHEVYEDIILESGDLFVTIAENDLVNLVKQIRDDGMEMGQDIGVISYNETPLKDLLGITVISTDFDQMGRTAAEVMLSKEIKKVQNPFRFIDRSSV
ncbi:GntR family transcriptional regulator [Neolewinella persica]|uniref:GntR family transcriptional regulator n=1 Tax=Neolewinella persica TaxID=70998 RepID=UPI00035E90D2|nr:GntR family transcriptional regulator [Neolewinella persica]